jgi:Family of unknown function (DUF5522)
MAEPENPGSAKASSLSGDTYEYVEGRDYTMEDGLLVFTRYYLLQRPCCGNGCRNCPYGIVPGSTTPVDE